MGVWERVVGDTVLPDVRILVVTLALALGLLTSRALNQFVASDPVVQHDIAAVFGTGALPVDVRQPQPQDRAVEVMDWPSVEYRP